MKKRVLFLGGSYFQLPPLKYARECGHHVITCDYLPSNPGHAFADEYHNVNATDLDAVAETPEAYCEWVSRYFFGGVVA